MRTRYDCLLDGRSLTQVDERLCVLDIRETPPEERFQTSRLAGRGGMLLTDRHRGALRVTVRFGIREQCIEARALVMEQVQKWCRGTRLQVSTRPGRWLAVVCTSLPQVASALAWTGTLEAVFTAWDVPYWQDMKTSSVTLTRSAATGTLFVPGSAENAPVCAEVKNTSSAVIGSMTITCGSTAMSFADLGLAAGETLLIGYDETDILSIAIKNGGGAVRSAMAKRTAGSGDDLLLTCGVRSDVAVSAPQSFEAVIRARGRWL